MSDRLRFHATCVGWPENDVHREGGLIEMIDNNRTITRRTFLKHVDRSDQAELEEQLGYAPHCEDACLHMASDWAVSYHRSKLHGKTVYYFRHSSIEYVFV